MRRWTMVLIAGCLMAGIGMGIVEAGKWLRILSLPGSPWIAGVDLVRRCIWPCASFIALGVVLAGYAASTVLVPNRRLWTLTAAVIGIAGGLLGFRLAVSASSPFAFTPPVYVVLFAFSLAVSAALLFHVFSPNHIRSRLESAIRGLIVAAGWVVLVVALRLASAGQELISFGGIGTFAAVAAPAELRTFPSLAYDVLSGALVGAFAGSGVACLLTRQRLAACMAWGAATGAWISLVLYLMHAISGTAIMQSAYSERIACYSSLLLGPIAGLLIGLGIAFALGAFRRMTWRLVVASVVVVALAAAALFVSDSRKGADLYLAALDAKPYRTRVYIHFHNDGAWSRTLETNADDIKLALCDRLLRDHPRSVYAAEAMYLKAKIQFDSWDFTGAAATLEMMRRRYLGSRGAGTLLQAQSYLAGGRYRSVVSGFGRDDWMFRHWSTSQGAQIIGRAYEVLGRTNAARGLYAYYIRELAGPGKGAWTSSAVQFAESGFDRTLSPQADSARFAAISGRAIVDGKPLAGVHLALVQPHIDASAPDDSKRFAGAKTVPLWFGIGTTTRSDGTFAIKDVPYGDYEVVVGFDAARVPSGYVISSPLAPVRVDREQIRLRNIKMAPGVRPVEPLNGIAAGSSPVLRWSEYPEAAYYSVSVVARPDLDPSGGYSGATRRGYTCWTKTRVTGTEVRITADGFAVMDDSAEEAQARGLVPNRTYSWMVFAYDDLGNMVSSSEHYRLDREPLFIATSGDSKGG